MVHKMIYTAPLGSEYEGLQLQGTFRRIMHHEHDFLENEWQGWAKIVSLTMRLGWVSTIGAACQFAISKDLLKKVAAPLFQ